MNNNLIEELYNKIEAQDKIINEQVLEIAELNENITWWQNRFHAVERNNRKLKERIDKAKEYINENWGHWCSNHCKYATETIEILGDKEN